MKSAAWTAPAIVVATAAPAHAAASSLLAIAYKAASYRGSAGVPGVLDGLPLAASQSVFLALTVTVTNKPIANLTCTVATGGNVSLSGAASQRSGTTWAATDPAGFTKSPATGQATSFTLLRAASTSATIDFNLAFANVQDADFPLKLVFTTTDANNAGMPTLTVNTSAVSPFLAATIS